ncbi:MAG TPA: polysaccharide pyruvyl transferase family protein [Rhizomicrobium sp.]
MTKKKIGLVGFFGWGNFGDELFLEAHKQFLGDLGDIAQINDLTKRPYFSRPLEQIIDECDAFVIGGGDLVIPWTVSDLYWNPAYLQKPVFVVGVGVPTWGGEKESVIKHYRNFLRSPSVKLIVARDKESMNWINKRIEPAVPAVFHPDLVCAMRLPRGDKQQRTLGIVLRQRNSQDDFSHVRSLCERAKSLEFKIKHIVLGTLATGAADLEVAKSFAEDGEEIIHSESLEELCRAISSCKMLASMKFHGTVVAAMYGVPSLVMSPTDKSRHFMKILERQELLCSFAKPNLADRMPRFPAAIPSHSRSYLKKAAQKGYEKLRLAISSGT